MKLQHRQNGFSLWSLTFTLLLISFVAFTAFKLFPVYMDGFAVKSSLESLEQDAAAEYRGALSVRKALEKRFDINNIRSIDRNAISIIRDADLYYVDVEYEKKIPFLYNISLLVSFSYSATVKASV